MRLGLAAQRASSTSARRPRWVGCLTVLAFLAGCLAPAAVPLETAAAPALEDALVALDAGEDLANFHLLGEWRNGNGAEVDAHGDLLYVMRAGTVQILNVSDPADIREVAVIDGPHGVLDVKVSDDGKYVFIGEDEYASGALGGTGPLLGGTWVYDVSDPASPEFVTYQPIGERRGPHMLAYHRFPDGREIVLGANADVSISEFDREAGTLTELARYQADLVTAFNRGPQVFDVLYQGWAHDMFAMTEADGTVLMYVANWDAGLRIVDITDPSEPEEVGGWNQFPDGDEGNLHTVATAWIGPGCASSRGSGAPEGAAELCRRITVGSVEVGFAVVGGWHYLQGTDHSVLYVWDTTDPANIELVGTWENPIDPTSGRDRVPGEEISSTHNLQLEDGRVYLAHYALGVWVLDVSTPGTQAEPVILGYYTEEGQSTWDVLLHHGIVWSSGAEGVLGLHYVRDVLGAGGLSGRA